MAVHRGRDTRDPCEVEVEAAKILHEFYGAKIEIPIAIDLITEKHELVDDLIFVELLEDKFGVAAVLVSKSNGHCDILVDEETAVKQKYRTNFSIAHELGHVVLHSKLYEGCDTIENSLLLNKRIENRCFTFLLLKLFIIFLSILS